MQQETCCDLGHRKSIKSLRKCNLWTIHFTFHLIATFSKWVHLSKKLLLSFLVLTTGLREWMYNSVVGAMLHLPKESIDKKNGILLQ